MVKKKRALPDNLPSPNPSRSSNNEPQDNTPTDSDDDPDAIPTDDILETRIPDDDLIDEEIEGDELIHENMLEDYLMDQPDEYLEDELDETEFEPMTAEQRLAAETALSARQGSIPSSSSLDTPTTPITPVAMDIIDDSVGALNLQDLADADDITLSLDNVQGPLAQWLLRDKPRRQISARFFRFLTTFTQSDLSQSSKTEESFYYQRIREMAERNDSSLVISFVHLAYFSSVMAMWLYDCPSQMLGIFDEVAFLTTCRFFPNYRQIQPEIRVRVADHTILESLRSLRYLHLNSLIMVSGVVTRRSTVFPHLKYVKLECQNCKSLLGPFHLTSEYTGGAVRNIATNDDQTASIDNTTGQPRLNRCPECETSGPFRIDDSQTVFRAFQKINLQESPSSVPPGRLPRQKEIILLDNLIDTVRPGDEIFVTGIYRNNFDQNFHGKFGFPVFSTIIEANYIHKTKGKHSTSSLTEEDIQDILKLSKDENIAERIVDSIAPSIYGRKDIKLSLALALFGGCAKSMAEGHRIRGDINVLILGDPGSAKSQLLKYMEKTAHRAVYSTGQGASAVGLTASVRRDPTTGHWTLEGGALVLADNGTCLIDEFDKMTDTDRKSIHEAMEQQSVSIAKAGIVATLHARCSVIAAANPLGGRYNPQLSFTDNVDLDDAILSRFDIVNIVRDVIDPVQDNFLASFVVQNHLRAHQTFQYHMQEFVGKFKHASIATPSSSFSGEFTPSIDTPSSTSSTPSLPTPSTPRHTIPGDTASFSTSSAFDPTRLKSYLDQYENNSLGSSKEDSAMIRALRCGIPLDAAIAKSIRPKNPIPQDMLKKYILYAKENCTPYLENIQTQSSRIAQLFADLKQQSKSRGAVPITARQLESIIRVAEAHAKMHLRPVVTQRDIDIAIRVQLESFIESQKHSVKDFLRKSFQKYLNFDKDTDDLWLHVLQTLVRETLQYDSNLRGSAPRSIEIPVSDLEQRGKEFRLDMVNKFLEQSAQFRDNGFQLLNRGRTRLIIKHLVAEPTSTTPSG